MQLKKLQLIQDRTFRDSLLASYHLHRLPRQEWRNVVSWINCKFLSYIVNVLALGTVINRRESINQGRIPRQWLSCSVTFLFAKGRKLQLTLKLSLQMAYLAASSVCVLYCFSWKDFHANHCSSYSTKWPLTTTRHRQNARKPFIFKDATQTYLTPQKADAF